MTKKIDNRKWQFTITARECGGSGKLKLTGYIPGSDLGNACGWLLMARARAASIDSGRAARKKPSKSGELGA